MEMHVPDLGRRVPFVGREQELMRLEAAFDDAVAGRGSLVLIVGEPGIGKTALCNHFLRTVAKRGGRTLSGRCYEGDLVSLPYFPFVEAFQSCLSVQPPEWLRQALGDEASILASMLAGLQIGGSAEVPLQSHADTRAARYRTFRAVESALRHICATCPAKAACLLLEDLHDGDEDTLDLLVYLGRRLADAPLLIVGSYRDLDVDSNHPLSHALAELRRDDSFQRTRLAGLALAQVREVLHALSGQPVPDKLAELVYDQTEGNPLFVQEVGRDLLAQGVLGGPHNAQEGATARALGFPDGLRDVIGRRLTRLSPPCLHLLSTAAVIGRDVALDLLVEAGGGDEDALIAGLNEAVRAGVLEEIDLPRAVGYRFAHALHRQLLLDELGAGRRSQLHQRLAMVLEAFYGADADGRAAELAEHYAYCTDRPGLLKAVYYDQRAAERALGTYAYGEAIRHLERALQTQERLDPTDALRLFDLLAALAYALMPSGRPIRAVTELAPRAYDLAQAIDDRERMFTACEIALVAIGRYGVAPMGGMLPLRDWAHRAAGCAAPGTRQQVFATLSLAVVEANEGRLDDAWRLRRGALALARRISDPEAIITALEALLLTPLGPEGEPERRALADEFSRREWPGVSTRALGRVCCTVGFTHIAWGEGEHATRTWMVTKTLAEQTNDAELRLRSQLHSACLAMLNGDLMEAGRLGLQLPQMGDELGSPVFGRQLAMVAAVRALLLLGRYDDAAWLFEQAAAVGDTSLRTECYRLIFLVSAGRSDEAQSLLERTTQPAGFLQQSRLPAAQLVCLLEAATSLGHVECRDVIAGRLAAVAGMVTSYNDLTSIARHLGNAAAAGGEYLRAVSYHERALELCARLGFRVEATLSRLALARCLYESGLRPSTSGQSVRNPSPAHVASGVTVLAHLQAAIPDLVAMHMQPALEQARWLVDRAGDVGATDGKRARPSASGLSARELEVLSLVVAGRRNLQIAETLGISLNTVFNHVSSILTKTGTANRTEAAAYARQHGLIE